MVVVLHVHNVRAVAVGPPLVQVQPRGRAGRALLVVVEGGHMFSALVAPVLRARLAEVKLTIAFLACLHPFDLALD